MPETLPTQIIILGGSGDLSQRKLLPALLDLYTRGKLPKYFKIIGLARTPRNDTEYRAFVTEALADHEVAHEHTESQIAEFCQHIAYVTGSFDDPDSYQRLKQVADRFDVEFGTTSNRLFYLAMPPLYYGQIFKDLKSSGVADETEKSSTHILVEKPFGNNLETAQELDALLADLYREDQIFRIDHYLAKEATQNILSFRFANRLLESPWNNRSIESVHIEMREMIDVGDRVGFYEGIGALRDVGQNHLLQMIALVAMREPQSFSAKAIREARAEVLQALKPIPAENLKQQVLRAQYEGYRSKERANDESTTETYFELRTEIDLPEWQGVPFSIRSGKALDSAEVSITIKLKDVATGLFETANCTSVGNLIKLTISPEQTIAITLNAKSPGLGFQLETRTLEFTCHGNDSEIKNSYEKVLYDAIVGDQTLFTRTEEVLAAWRFITPILEQWQDLPLYSYKVGSAGPTETIIDTK